MSSILFDLVDLVAEMRAEQRSYFKTRTKGALLYSKDLEAKVDVALAWCKGKRGLLEASGVGAGLHEEIARAGVGVPADLFGGRP